MLTEISEEIAVDLDGTLAKWYGIEITDYDPLKIGEPIWPMVNRVKKWLAEGKKVVIFTARVHPKHEEQVEITKGAIRKYCMELFGQELEITCEKSPAMTQIWDDRVVTVEKDTGRVLTMGIVVVSGYRIDSKLKLLVNNCARCGGDHHVEFRKFSQACENWTHWASCPETGEPILMQFEEDEPDSLGSLI